MTDSKLKDLSDRVAPSKGAWTPGPWEVEIGKSPVAFRPDAICLIEFSPDRSIIVKVSHRERVLSGAREADALLISKSPQMADMLRRSKQEHFDMAALLDAWAKESVDGGWSTHQVDAMRRRADKCRKYGAEAESLLTELEGKL